MSTDSQAEDVNIELEAMRAVRAALVGIPPDVQIRILRWAVSALGIPVTVTPGKPPVLR